MTDQVLTRAFETQKTDQATRPKRQAHPVSGALGARDLYYKTSAHPKISVLCNTSYIFFRELVLTKMDTINVYEYLENDHTLINDLVNLDFDSSNEDPVIDPLLYDEQNKQIIHDHNTANAEVPPTHQV